MKSMKKWVMMRIFALSSKSRLVLYLISLTLGFVIASLFGLPLLEYLFFRKFMPIVPISPPYHILLLTLPPLLFLFSSMVKTVEELYPYVRAVQLVMSWPEVCSDILGPLLEKEECTRGELVESLWKAEQLVFLKRQLEEVKRQNKVAT